MEETREQFGTLGFDFPKPEQSEHPSAPISTLNAELQKGKSLRKGAESSHYPVQGIRD